MLPQVSKVPEGQGVHLIGHDQKNEYWKVRISDGHSMFYFTSCVSHMCGHNNIAHWKPNELRQGWHMRSREANQMRSITHHGPQKQCFLLRSSACNLKGVLQKCEKFWRKLSEIVSLECRRELFWKCFYQKNQGNGSNWCQRWVSFWSCQDLD